MNVAKCLDILRKRVTWFRQSGQKPQRLCFLYPGLTRLFFFFFKIQSECTAANSSQMFNIWSSEPHNSPKHLVYYSSRLWETSINQNSGYLILSQGEKTKTTVLSVRQSLLFYLRLLSTLTIREAMT